MQPSDILVGFRARDKWDAVDRILEHLVRSGRIDPGRVGAFRDAVIARERSMTTGMERELAIPHAALDEVPQVIGCLAIVVNEEGLDFGSIDGSPTRFVVLLLIPRSQKLLHIRTLADVARLLGNEGVRNALRASKSSAEAWNALAEAERAGPQHGVSGASL